MPVDPVKPMLKPPGTKRLKLKCDVLLSSFAFKINLRRSIKAHLPSAAAGTQILMCGPPMMMEKAVKPALESLGYTKDMCADF